MCFFMICLSIPVKADIPSNANVFNGHSYMFYNTGCKWSEANIACQALGGHLVTITSKEEQAFCEQLIGSLIPKYCWIGAMRSSGSWTWVTGESWSYENWEEGQPNGSGGGDYAMICRYPDEEVPFTWDDQGDSGTSPSSYWSGSPYYQNTSYYSYICEWDAVPAPKPVTQPVTEPVTQPVSEDKTVQQYKNYTGEGMKPLSKSTAAVKKTITTSKREEIKGDAYPLLQAKAVNVKKTSFKLKWNKLPGATKYLIYGNRCGKKNKYQFIKSTTKTYYKPKKLKQKKYYKYLVVAVMDKKVISVSKTVHVGLKPKQNPTKVKVSSRDVTLLLKGSLKTYQISAGIEGTSLKQHRGLSYESDNTKVAKVTKKGVIKAVGAGECSIYVYAQNGVSAKIAVTVLAG